VTDTDPKLKDLPHKKKVIEEIKVRVPGVRLIEVVKQLNASRQTVYSWKKKKG
jgi:hypothetical protein